MSGKCSARCSRSTSRIQRRSSAEAKRKRAEQLLLARQRLGAGDLPAHRQALEQELDRALPRVLLGEDVAAGDLGVLRAGRGRQRAAQHEHRAVLVAVLALRRADALAAAALLRHRRDGSVPPVRDASRPERATSAAASGCCRASGGCGCRSTCPASRTATRGRCSAGDGIVLVDTGMHDRGSMGNLERALEQTGHQLARRPAGRDHPRPHRPLRAGAADRRARGLRGLDAPARGSCTRAAAGPRSHDRGRAAERRARGAAAALGGAAPRRGHRPGRRRCTPTATSSRASTIETDAGDLAGGRDARPRAVARLPAPARAAPADLRRPSARPRLAVLRRRLHAGPGRRVPALARRRRARSTPGSRSPATPGRSPTSPATSRPTAT